MKKYYFNVLRLDYSLIESISIPDGSSKKSAFNLAKRLIKENNVEDACYLEVNSIIMEKQYKYTVSGLNLYFSRV